MLPKILEISEEGAFFPPSVIAAVRGKSEHELNDFDLWAVRQLIENETKRTVRQEGKALRVLSHQEAFRYGHHRFGSLIGGLLRRFWLNKEGVDRTQLSDDEKKVHDRNIEVQGKVVYGIVPILVKHKTIDISDKKLPRLDNK